ncbi:uncharacterized protein LOC128879983 [Hylaeus volcanicus]|uniref:uncharacterized protein LOC128879983 n=1 Tax=Hylaeus volcanicus TaxID=313075 RepID=UPI0023B7D2CC|nr:uncharacterized protein LOC128879983 [Hylaeus volcanicus]
MAPPKRKTRGSLGKKRSPQPRYSHRQHRKRAELPRRLQTRQPIDTLELFYRLLNDGKHNEGKRGRVSLGRDRFRGKMRKYENHRDTSYDTSSCHDSTDSMEESEYTKSGATSTENLSRVMDATNSSWATGSENSSVSNTSVEPITLGSSINNTRSLLKKKSLVQIINNYIKAGIEEGKRQAKKYIRKALSFGMKSGYLIPADPDGQVIRVSPTLVESRRSDPELRRKRRRARKGEEEPPYVNRKDRRRGTPLLITKRKPRRENSPEPVVPKKRRKTSTTKKQGMDLKVTYVNPKTKVAARKRRTKEPTEVENKRVMKKREPTVYYKLAAPKNKRENRRSVNRTPSKHKNDTVDGRRSNKGRLTKSPHRDKNGSDDPKKKQPELTEDEDEDSTKSSDNEPNHMAATERRKSASSRDGIRQDADETPGYPAREVEEQLASTNNDDNEKNADGNVD